MGTMEQERPAPAKKTLNLLKYLILVLTCGCVVIEIIQIVVGAVVNAVFDTYSIFIDRDFIVVTHFLIAIGVILFFIAIFGISAIVYENGILLYVYAGLFIFIVILEIVLAVTAFQLVDDSNEMVYRRVGNVLERFFTDSVARAGMNRLQTNMNCCGIRSHSDWATVHPLEGSSLPTSCCRTFNEDICVPHGRGCHAPMNHYVETRMHLIATGTIIIIFYQTVCIMTAFALAVKLTSRRRQRQNLLSNNANEIAQEHIITEKPRF